MEHIEKSNRAGKSRERPLNIVKAKVDILISLLRDTRSLADFPGVDIQAQDRLAATALTQIKAKQTHSASDIENRLVRAGKQLVGRGIDGVAAQFTPDIAPQPALGKLGGHTGARRLMSSHIAGEVFHLIRIIALPD